MRRDGGEFISEPILPARGTFATADMGRGLPGLPASFTWRRRSFDVVECLEAWKESSREGGSAAGELYLRRHCFRLLMSDGCVWTVYFNRQPSRGGNRKARWFLYSIHRSATAGGPVC